MVLDVLALALFLGVRWAARRYSEPDPIPPELPFEDLPPVTAVDDRPRGRKLNDYVEQGFDEIDQWLHHRDEAAPPPRSWPGGDPVNP
jgi:hypothetical protein